jgi:RNA polymerase sigma-70 factor, ECF subfamily
MSDVAAAPQWQIEKFRNVLGLLARLQFDPRLQPKLDPSDVVQDALLRAHEKLAEFRGHSEVELAAWLRTILANCLAQKTREYSRQKRDIGLERSLETSLEESSARVEAWLADAESTPAQKAVRQEQLLRLAEMLADLPPDQRLAVELRYLQGWPIADIAQQMDRSTMAISKLLGRGLDELREQLHDESSAQGIG